MGVPKLGATVSLGDLCSKGILLVYLGSFFAGALIFATLTCMCKACLDLSPTGPRTFLALGFRV